MPGEWYTHHTRPAPGWSWLNFYPKLWEAGYDLIYQGIRSKDGGPLGYPDLKSAVVIERLKQPGFVLPGANRHTRAAVYFKAIPSDSMESKILRLLSTPPLSQDPRNHGVPILDVVRHGTTEVAIMPSFLTAFMTDSFLSYKQVYDCVDQILEGLDFLHENFIAHMDISGMNLLWDDQGYSAKNRMAGRNPADVAGRYYFIDFQASQICTADPRTHMKELEMCTTPPPEAKDYGAKEKPMARYIVNAFALDIWNTGCILEHSISTFYELKSVKSRRLRDLVAHMLEDRPEDRPTAREALDFFRKHKAEMEREEEFLVQ